MIKNITVIKKLSKVRNGSGYNYSIPFLMNINFSFPPLFHSKQLLLMNMTIQKWLRWRQAWPFRVWKSFEIPNIPSSSSLKLNEATWGWLTSSSPHLKPEPSRFRPSRAQISKKFFSNGRSLITFERCFPKSKKNKQKKKKNFKTFYSVFHLLNN